MNVLIGLESSLLDNFKDFATYLTINMRVGGNTRL